MLTWTPWLASGPSDCFHSALSSLSIPTDSSGTSFCAAKFLGDGERRRVKSRNVCEGQQRHGNCAIQRSGVAPTRSHWSLCTRGTIMRVATKALLLSAFVLSLSGTAYAQGAGTSGGGGAGAGQGGTGMATPNASGTTESPSGASGANTMGKSGDMSQKQMKPKTQKKGGMDAPASEGGGMKKAY
jgi:hypothetical protein